MNCIEIWILNWKKNGWMLKNGLPVKNLNDLQKLDRLSSQLKIKWVFYKF